MNDTYISTESLNRQLDEAYNRGIEDCLVENLGMLCKRYKTQLDIKETEVMGGIGIVYKCELTISFEKARMFCEITYAPTKKEAKSIALRRLMTSIISYAIEGASGEWKRLREVLKNQTTK